MARPFNFEWAGEGYPFEYVWHDFLNERVIGTVVFHRNRAEVESSLAAVTSPAFSLEKNNFTGLVYLGFFMDVTNYLRHLKGDWDAKPEEARNREDAANRLLEVFRKIVKLLRDHLVRNANPFANLAESVGIEENGTVKLMKGPGVDPISDSFEANVLELGSIAEKFRVFLSTTIENESAASELRVYEEFLASYEEWMQLHPNYRTELNFLALHHPSTMDSTSNVRMVMNFGFLSRVPCSPLKLSLCEPFQRSIQMNLPEWAQIAEKDPLLHEILNDGGYETKDICKFCDDVLDHYLHSIHEQYTKIRKLNYLEARIGNVRHYMFTAYVEAILEGYKHQLCTYKDLCNNLI